MGSGFKTFTASVLTASEVNNYLMEQSVMSFASTGARDATVTAPEIGMTAYIGSAAPGRLMSYAGSAWRDVQVATRTHGCAVYHSVSQAIAGAGAGAALAFNSEETDTDAYHSTTTNTSRITVPTGLGGLYQITAYCRWTSSSVTTPIIGIWKNGTPQIRTVGFTTTYATLFCNTTLFLAAGDYIELFAAHFTGVNRDVDAVTAASGGVDPRSPFLSAYLISGTTP